MSLTRHLRFCSLFVLAALGAHLSGQAPPSPKRTGSAGGEGRGYPDIDPAAVERGQKEFVATCGFCHGPSAKGGEGGPDLIRSEIVLDDDHGEKIGAVVLNGRPDKGMPKFSLSPGQISDIAAFLHNGVKAAALRGSYKILNIVTGDPKAGEAYFNGDGKCNTCHSATGDLKGIGAKYDPVTLQTKFLMPRGRSRRSSGRESTPPTTVTVTLPSGQVYQGRLEHIDDFAVALRQSDGSYNSFSRDGDVPKIEIHDPLKAHSDMLTKYTDPEIHNLTAWLVTLK